MQLVLSSVGFGRLLIILLLSLLSPPRTPALKSDGATLDKEESNIVFWEHVSKLDNTVLANLNVIREKMKLK